MQKRLKIVHKKSKNAKNCKTKWGKKLLKSACKKQKLEQLWKISTGGGSAATDFFHLCSYFILYLSNTSWGLHNSYIYVNRHRLSEWEAGAPQGTHLTTCSHIDFLPGLFVFATQVKGPTATSFLSKSMPQFNSVGSIPIYQPVHSINTRWRVPPVSIQLDMTSSSFFSSFCWDLPTRSIN